MEGVSEEVTLSCLLNEECHPPGHTDRNSQTALVPFCIFLQSAGFSCLEFDTESGRQTSKNVTQAGSVALEHTAGNLTSSRAKEDRK